MTYAPASLTRLSTYWERQGGVSLGIVGDTRHVRGYHLGRDRIYASTGEGDRDYSVQTFCDKRGLTEAASAIDLGRLKGTLPRLYEFSRWLVERCRAGAPDTEQIREIIYSPDGRRVLRWDRERGVSSLPREGEADDSHLTHTHISFYRCYQTVEKVPIFKPFFEGEDDMAALQYKLERWRVPKGTPFYNYPEERASIGTFSADAEITTVGAPYRIDGTINWAWRLAIVRTAAIDRTLSEKLVWVPRRVLTYVGLADPVADERQRWLAWLATAPKGG